MDNQWIMKPITGTNELPEVLMNLLTLGVLIVKALLLLICLA